MSYRTILLFGAPGAGKGTQGKILGTVPGFFHCSCGEVFRSLSLDSERGRMFAQYADRGQLVPDGPTVELWQDFIQSSIESGRFYPERDILMLDGIPRTVSQAEIMRDKVDVLAIFNLCCARAETLVDRLRRRALKENRQDDANIDVIRNRLQAYERETQPLLDFYPPSLLRQVEAGQTPLKVVFDILGHLVNLLPV
jgi:adenylate kinase